MSTQQTSPASPQRPLTQQMLSGVAWSAAQTWLLRIVNLGSFVLLSRLLAPEDFGLVALAAAFGTLLSVVTEGGFSSFLVQRTSLDEKTKSTAFWTALAVSFVCGGLMCAGAPLLALAYSEPGLTPIMMVLAITLPLTGLSSVQSALLQRDLQFKSLAMRQIWATLVATVLVVALALAGAGVWALVAQNVGFQLVASIMLWRASSWRPRMIWDKAQAKTMLSFSWKVLSGNLLVQLRDRAEQFIIAAVGGAVLLGYWTVATRIISLLVEMSVSVIQKVMLPAFSRLKTDPPRLKRTYRQALTYTAMLVVPVMVLCSQTSDEVIPLVFGAQWHASAQVAMIMAISSLAASMNYFDRPMYLAQGRPGTDLLMTSIIVPLHVAAVLIAAPHGLVWVAIAVTLRTFLVWPLRLAVLKRVCDLPWSSYTGMLPLLLAALPMAGAMALMRNLWPSAFDRWGFLWLVLAGLVVFGSIALVVSPDTRFVIRKIHAKVRRKLSRAEGSVPG